MKSSNAEEVVATLKSLLGGRVRNLSVIEQGGRVVLLGTAGNYYAKQMAQHFVLQLLEACNLDNKIQVEPIP